MTTSAIVAILGGGQLGRMLGLAAVPLGIECRFLDPSADAGAGAVGTLVVAPLDDLDAAERAAAGADVVTYEWEGVPAATARHLAARAPVCPPPAALDVAQDRVAEKECCRRLGIPIPEFAAAGDRSELEAALDRVGLPSVCKTRRGGYDGKGQVRIETPADVERAWATLGGVPLVVESWVEFRRELSILAVRGHDGTTSCYPLVENRHADGILRVSLAPAPDVDERRQSEAEWIARRIMDDLDYVGVLAVELFEDRDRLLVNELAPRVHNSGHWTIEGAATSQFENHLRAILGWPIGSCAAVGASAMVNCIGTLPDLPALLPLDGVHVHHYGKAPRPGRKVGHVTVVADDEATRDDRLAQVLPLVDGSSAPPAP